MPYTTLSNLPSLAVYVAWTDGPYVASPVWSEITEYVRSVNVRRGRADDLQQFQAGTASIVLDNRLRLFDPFNSSGANFNNLKPRRQIKIEAVWNSITYSVFRGFVSGWPVEYTDAGFDSTVTIECFDLLGLIATESTDTNLFVDYIKSLSPVYYWTLEELSQIRGDTSVVCASQGSRSANLNLTLKNQAIEPPPLPGVVAPLFGAYSNDQGGGEYVDSKATAIRTGDISVVFIYKTGSGRFSWSSTAGIFLTLQGVLGTKIQFKQLGNTSASDAFCIQASINDFYNIASAKTSIITADDQPHLIVMTYVYSTGAIKLYMDGVDVTTSASNASSDSPDDLYSLSFRPTLVYPGGSGSSPDYGKIALNNVAWTHDVLTSSEIAELKRLAFELQEETTLARYQRTMTYSDVSSSLIQYPASTSGTVDEFNYDGRTTYDLLQEVARSEGGDVFVNAAGTLVTTNRDYVFGTTTSNTSQFTFTDSGTGVKYDARSIRMAFDADKVRNTVTVTGTGDASSTVSSSASISSIGIAGEVVNTVLKNQTETLSLANRLVSIFKNPKLQLEPFITKGQENPSYDWSRLLSLDLLNRVTFKRTPSVGSAVQRDLLVQSIEHQITPGTWQTVVNGSTRYTGWFILGISLLGSSEDVLL